MKKGSDFVDYWLYSSKFIVFEDVFDKAEVQFKKYLKYGCGHANERDKALSESGFINSIKAINLEPVMNAEGTLIGLNQPDDVDLFQFLWSDYGFIFLEFMSGLRGGECIFSGDAVLEIAEYQIEEDRNIIQKFAFSGGSVTAEVYSV